MLDINQVWKYKFSPSYYRVVAVANIDHPNEDYQPTVCYQEMTNGKVYARSIEYFLTKMERIS